MTKKMNQKLLYALHSIRSYANNDDLTPLERIEQIAGRCNRLLEAIERDSSLPATNSMWKMPEGAKHENN